MDTRLFELGDGRELAWIECGAADGAPVMVFHGSPGTRHQYVALSDVAAASGVRLIAPDRPGYGHSSYDPARTLTSWARDVEQLADHLAIDRFAVVGTSGGGPNAASCARFLGARLDGCAIVSGVAPPDAAIGERAALRLNRVLQRVAPVAPRLTSRLVGASLRRAQRFPDKVLAWMRRTLPACDVAVIDGLNMHGFVRDDLTRPLAATAPRAAVQDLEIGLRPWGFRLSDIAIPVQVWHGDLDRNVVVESGVYQAAQIPRATLHRVPDAGHWLIYSHFAEILRSLRE
jgi:pimeloyl-ACP methyl ester carboxylesterase